MPRVVDGISRMPAQSVAEFAPPPNALSFCPGRLGEPGLSPVAEPIRAEPDSRGEPHPPHGVRATLRYFNFRYVRISSYNPPWFEYSA